MNDPAPVNLPSTPESTFYGARWAGILGAALIVALAFFAALRWCGSPATATEQFVPVPVPAVTPTPLPPPEVLAPDPGDTP